jgi:HSP20 family protein
MRIPPKETAAEFDQVSAQVSRLIGNLWQWHTGEFSPNQSWSPSINVYRLTRRFEICVDLAGVDKNEIDIRVEPGRLVLRGFRQAPDPTCGVEENLRIVSMEIDHGPFCRTIALPDQVDLSRVQSRYENGLLWIDLPLRDPA